MVLKTISTYHVNLVIFFLAVASSSADTLAHTFLLPVINFRHVLPTKCVYLEISSFPVVSIWTLCLLVVPIHFLLAGRIYLDVYLAVNGIYLAISTVQSCPEIEIVKFCIVLSNIFTNSGYMLTHSLIRVILYNVSKFSFPKFPNCSIITCRSPQDCTAPPPSPRCDLCEPCVLEL